MGWNISCLPWGEVFPVYLEVKYFLSTMRPYIFWPPLKYFLSTLRPDIFWPAMGWNISCLPYAHIYSGHHWGEIFPVHLETKYYLSLTTILYILLASFIAGGLYDRLWEALTAGQGDSHAHCPAPWNLPSEPGNLATTLPTPPSKPTCMVYQRVISLEFSKTFGFSKTGASKNGHRQDSIRLNTKHENTKTRSLGETRSFHENFELWQTIRTHSLTILTT